jgi:hypothetical protein
VCIGGFGVRAKGSSKRVVKPNFWKGYEDKVPIELKELVYEQYLSQDLFVYCDASQKRDYTQQSIACTYVQNTSIVVKQRFVYLPRDCINQIFYGEMEAVMFALKHFSKNMMASCKNVIIFSDILTIEQLITGEATFKNPSLKKLQKEMVFFYQIVKKQYPNLCIEIKHLCPLNKKYNPFHNASHNAAYSMFRRD